MNAQRPTWCEIDRSAITHNLATLGGMVGPKVGIYVCVKGDASGCGDIEVSRTAEKAGAAGVAFGNLDRAMAARQAGVHLPILLYPTCLPDSAPALEAHGMMPTISTMEDVAAWSSHAKSLKVFLKLDGGGFRAGALPHQAPAIARAIQNSNTLTLAGAYGHPMASYGPVDPVFTDAQINSCIDALKQIAVAGIDVPVRMVSSSAIILSHPHADLNAVDPGRLAIGQSFPAAAGRERTWRQALVGLRSHLVMVKSLEDIGDVMPAPFLARRPGMKIGLIPYGWSDGYPKRIPENATALLHGKRVRLLGPTHSELLRVDLTDVPEAKLGDEVVLLGRQGNDEIGLEELAAQWKVGVSDLYGAIGKSVRRHYLN
jgi:alanine racemase